MDRNLVTALIAGAAVWALMSRKGSPEGKVTILDVRRAPKSIAPKVSGLDET